MKRLQQTAEFRQLQTDALKSWTEDYVNNLPSKRQRSSEGWRKKQKEKRNHKQRKEKIDFFSVFSKFF